MATVDAYISCKTRDVTISNGVTTQKLVLYPPSQPSPVSRNPLRVGFDENDTLPILTTRKALQFKNETEDDSINSFNSSPSSVSSPTFQSLDVVMTEFIQEDITNNFIAKTIKVLPNHKSIPIENESGKTLNINPNLSMAETNQVIKLLQENKEAFAWDYVDMKGISPTMCKHHLYIKDNCRLVYHPQRRLNPTMKEIVKIELQKFLNVGFIYPISDSQWVSPLVVIPKKNGKWRICVDYRELNKATQKDRFPLPFIDQVLDNLSGKKYFSFLDGFSGYNQIQIALED